MLSHLILFIIYKIHCIDLISERLSQVHPPFSNKMNIRN